MTTYAIVQNGSDPQFGPVSIALVDADGADEALVKYLTRVTRTQLSQNVRTTEAGAEVEHAGVHYSAVPHSRVPVKPSGAAS